MDALLDQPRGRVPGAGAGVQRPLGRRPPALAQLAEQQVAEELVVAVPGARPGRRVRPRRGAGALRERLGCRLVEGGEEQVGPQHGRQDRPAGAGAGGRRVRRRRGRRGGRRRAPAGRRRAARRAARPPRCAAGSPAPPPAAAPAPRPAGSPAPASGGARRTPAPRPRPGPGPAARGPPGAARPPTPRWRRSPPSTVAGAGGAGSARARKAAASAGVKRRSPARTSTSWPPRAQPGQRQRRVHPRREHQPQPGRGAAQQRVQHRVHPPVAHLLVVVQDDDGRRVQRRRGPRPGPRPGRRGRPRRGSAAGPAPPGRRRGSGAAARPRGG